MNSIGLFVALAAGGLSVCLILLALPSVLVDHFFDAKNPVNWFIWIFGIVMGVASLIMGFCLWWRWWKPVLKEGLPFKAALIRTLVIDALFGVGVILSWFTLTRIATAWLLLCTQQ